MSGLREALDAAAEAPILLVACDFDGTLSPIAPRPDHARADPAALRALTRLGDLPHTHAAVVSGRGLKDLSGLVAPAGRVRLVGSHGAESDSGPRICVTPEGRAALAALAAEVRAIAASLPGSLVEVKPAGVALHYRGADPAAAHAVVDAVLAGPARREGVHVLRGHAVVELSVVEPDKGKALAALRHRVGAAATVFLGDDVTDEPAFRVLGPGDVGIRVGPGETAAAHRVGSQADVAHLLERVLAVRTACHERRRPTPIERHAVLSDQRTIALLDPRGSIVWLCLPRIDSTALFAALLGGETAGFFSVEPVGGGEPKQEYAGDSFVLRTAWPGVTVTDYLDCSGGRPFQRAGRSDLVRVVEGSARVALRFAPRPDFGRAPTRLIPRDGGLEVDGWLDPIVLHSPGVRWSVREHGQQATATAEVEVAPDRPIVLELRYGTGSLRPAMLAEPERRRQTERFWTGWVTSLRIPKLHAARVRRSACVLKALCHGPTGAIVAAGTTSLPAPIGGSRNWDYRYCWPRDSCLAAAALLRLGNTGTAIKLLDWLVGVVDACESPERIRPIYTVSGSKLGPEGEIGALPGYAGSRPVRVGNAAANQVQLDVFGPIVDVVALLAEAGAPITPQYWRLVEAMIDAVAARWREPDHGIWELRTHRRHNVHTKVMSWHAVNRAIAVAEHAAGRSRPAWEALRDQIARDVLAHGWSEEAGAFTAAYGEDTLDAASLAVGLTGLLPPDDPKLLATVDAVNRELRRGPAVHRYRSDDGLPGVEGGFNLCTTWLIEALALVGRVGEARELLDAYAALAGPTGLMSEEFDPDTGLSLGNYPQAYSHLGLINAAVRLGALEAAG